MEKNRVADADITFAQYQTELADIKAALRTALISRLASDYATALAYVAIAETTLSGLEESENDGGMTVKYRTNLQSLKESIIKAQNAAAEATGSGGFDVACVGRPES